MSSDDESDLEYENILSGSNSDESDESSDEESENEEWQLLSSEAFTPPPDRFPFTASPGPTVLQDELDVLEYFKLFINDYVCDLLVVETNRYAQQQPTTSEPTNWKPVSKEEILIFLAVIILQGIVKKPDAKLYWSKREIIHTPFFSKILPYQRYIEIKKNFHKKIFFQLLDVCIFNSFVLYQKNGGKRHNLDYRMCLVERLVESYNTSMSSSKRGRPSATPSPLRLTERHFPKIVPATEKKKNVSRMCVVCSKNKKRKESRYECQDCNVGLCIVPCFEIFHTKLNY